MRPVKGAARIDPAVAAYWRKVFARHGVASKNEDAVLALTATGVDVATAQANEVMRLARDHTSH